MFFFQCFNSCFNNDKNNKKFFNNLICNEQTLLINKGTLGEDNNNYILKVTNGKTVKIPSPEDKNDFNLLIEKINIEINKILELEKDTYKITINTNIEAINNKNNIFIKYIISIKPQNNDPISLIHLPDVFIKNKFSFIIYGLNINKNEDNNYIINIKNNNNNGNKINVTHWNFLKQIFLNMGFNCELFNIE
jgi:hypothetical protein